MSCLDNLIGIRAKCTADSPDSELYFEDLAGMSIEKADNTMDKRFDSGIDLIGQKIVFAQKYVENRVRSFYDEKIQVTSVVENDVLGIWKDNLRLINSDTVYKGIQLDLRQTPHLRLFISRIGLFVDSTGTIPVKIINLVTGKIIDSIDVEAVAGEQVVIDIYKQFKSEGNLLNLFIGYDATGIDSYDTRLRASFKNCASCRKQMTYHNRLYANAGKLALAGPLTDQNVKSTSDTGGLTLTYSLQCASDDQICNIRNLLAWAILHKAGEFVLQEMQNSERLNNTIVVYGDDRDKLIEDFKASADDSLSEVLKNIRLPENECFKCKSRIITRTRVP